jgi:hypothetical protein
MKHALKNSIEDNMHGLLECIFVDYANQLRANYPGRITDAVLGQSDSALMIQPPVEGLISDLAFELEQ